MNEKAVLAAGLPAPLAVGSSRLALPAKSPYPRAVPSAVPSQQPRKLAVPSAELVNPPANNLGHKGKGKMRAAVAALRDSYTLDREPTSRSSNGTSADTSNNKHVAEDSFDVPVKKMLQPCVGGSETDAFDVELAEDEVDEDGLYLDDMVVGIQVEGDEDDDEEYTGNQLGDRTINPDLEMEDIASGSEYFPEHAKAEEPQDEGEDEAIEDEPPVRRKKLNARGKARQAETWMMNLWLLDGNKERHVASAIHGIGPLHPPLMKLLTMLLVNGVVAKLLTQMLASLTFHALRLATSHFSNYTQLPLRLLAGQSSILMATLSETLRRAAHRTDAPQELKDALQNDVHFVSRLSSLPATRMCQFRSDLKAVVEQKLDLYYELNPESDSFSEDAAAWKKEIRYIFPGSLGGHFNRNEQYTHPIFISVTRTFLFKHNINVLRTHPSIFSEDYEGTEYKVIPCAFIALVATAIYSCLCDRAFDTANPKFTVDQYAPTYQCHFEALEYASNSNLPGVIQLMSELYAKASRGIYLPGEEPEEDFLQYMDVDGMDSGLIGTHS
ncbi:hypothetical protein PHLGIDRAFT_122539 [Phlebiopsis gigantea 11061_1 CR5-6]|uniref:DUF6532 domain-containing protein n=1 Tax=Phlebiopsis gigantea (strain 11061_1 CR5-6) TaxID=745531 RepID=A0A0C3NCV2_PHLG1|nr:hypothetical protein PHLGIDRAFT_122539 [Phlebiopsis gigantea 11061_1 CR5-6]